MQPEARQSRVLVDSSDLPQLNLRREWTPLIWALCLITGGALIAFAVWSLLAGPQPIALVNTIVAVLLLILNVSALRHLQRADFATGVQLLVAIMISAVTYAVSLTDMTFRPAYVAMYVLPIALSALLLGRRHLLATTGLAVAAVSFIATLQTVLSSPGPGDPGFHMASLTNLLLYLVMLILLGLFLDRFTATLQGSMRELHRQVDLNRTTYASLQSEVLERRAAESARATALDLERTARAHAERANSRSIFLADLGLLSSEQVNPENVLRELPRMLSEQYCDWVTINLRTKDGRLERVSSWHRNTQLHPKLEQLTKLAPDVHDLSRFILDQLRDLKPVLIPGMAEEFGAATAASPEYRQLLEELGFNRVLLVPLVANGELLGSMALVDCDGSATFEGEDHYFYAEVGRRAAALVVKARHYQEQLDLNEQLEQRVAERTAQLQAVNAELEAFTYSASHDLRTPLRGIDGFSQALLEDYGDSLDETAHGYIRRIRNGAVRMGELIDDLLSLSRVSQGPLQRTEVDMSALAEELLADRAAAEPDRNVNWTVEPGLNVLADGQLLKICLENLLGNSWKFTAERDPALIEIGATADAEETVYHVRDNGDGFNMDYAPKLFVPFQRLHGEEFSGSGIGLATVYRIVRRHGGRIWAESSEGEGASFYFTLEPAAAGGKLGDHETRL